MPAKRGTGKPKRGGEIPKPLYALVYIWLWKVLERGRPNQVDLDAWHRRHLSKLPTSEWLLSYKNLGKCYAKTTSRSPVGTSLYEHLDKKQDADSLFAANLAGDGAAASDVLGLMLCGLIVKIDKKFMMLLPQVQNPLIMVKIRLSASGSLTSFAAQDSGLGTLFLLSPGFSFSELGTHTHYWPQFVVDHVKRMTESLKKRGVEALQEDQSGDDEIDGDDDEDDDEGDDEIDEHRRSGGSRRGGVSDGATRKQAAAGAPDKPADQPGALSRPADQPMCVRKLADGYSKLTPEEKLIFRKFAKLIPEPQQAVSRLIGPIDYKILLTDELAEILGMVRGLGGHPYEDIQDPPDKMLDLRAKHHVGDLLGDFELPIISALQDGLVYWWFFLSAVHYIKRNKPFDAAAKPHKKVCYASVILELVRDMKPALMLWKEHGPAYVDSGGLFVLPDGRFIPFQDCWFFKHKNVPDGLRTRYTKAVETYLGQRWPLSAARHLAVRAVWKAPVFVAAMKTITQTKACSAWNKRNTIRQDLFALLSSTDGQSVRAIRAVKGFTLYRVLPSDEPLEPFSSGEDPAGEPAPT